MGNEREVNTYALEMTVWKERDLSELVRVNF